MRNGRIPAMQALRFSIHAADRILTPINAATAKVGGRPDTTVSPTGPEN
jgi:hypothetical protein